MRILVFSDSHGNTSCMDRAISAVGSFDAIIHLGDIDRDVRYLEQKYSDKPIYAVLGNNDFYVTSRPNELILELDGVKLYLCHGHTKGVRSGLLSLKLTAEQNGCAAALFGHTHIAVNETEDGILLFNPGSCSLPHRGRPSFGVLELENGRCSAVVADWII